MIMYRCSSCGRESFGKRAVCPVCRGEEFTEAEPGKPSMMVSSRLTVTPEGFDDSYTLVLGQVNGVKLLYRIPDDGKT